MVCFVKSVCAEAEVDPVAVAKVAENRDAEGRRPRHQCAIRAVSGAQRCSDEGGDDGGDDGGGSATDQGSAVLESEQEPELKRPPMYKVIILNDDYTPMEFVVHVLENFFNMAREKATQIMLQIHTQGSAVVGIFPKDLAETKSEQVNEYAQDNNHPLMTTVELTD